MLTGTAGLLRALTELSPRALNGVAIGLRGPSDVAPGGTVRWQLALTNTGAVTASGALSAFVPAPMEAPVAPGASIVPVPGGYLVGWSVDLLGPGEAFAVSGGAAVPRAVATPLTRTIAATGTLGAPPEMATAFRTIAFGPTDVRLELASGAMDVRPTELLTHALAIDNLHRAAAEGAVVTLTLDARTAFVSDSLAQSELPWPPAAVSRTVGAGFVSWRLPPLAGPVRVAFHVVTRVDEDAPAGASVVHAAVLTAATVDATALDNAVTAAPVPIVVPDLWIRKTGSPSTTAGGFVDYEITWGNDGGRARDVVITDTLPPGTVWVSSTPGAELLDAGRVRWHRGPAPATGDDPLEIVRVRVRVDDAVGGGTTLVNHAAIGSSAPDAAPGDDADMAATTVSGAPAPQADLRVGVGGPAFLAPGGQATFAISVTNAGPEAAAGTILTATLPAELAATAASLPGQTGGDHVVWSIGPLADGASRSVDVTVTVPADAPIDVTRTLQVAASSSMAPGNPADDAAEHRVALVPTDVRVSLEPVGPAIPGERVRHTVAVTNSGLAAAEDVAVMLTLDPDLLYAADDLGAQPSVGSFDREVLPDGVRWTLVRLPGGATRAWTVESELDEGVPAGTPVTATLAATTATRDASTTDDAMAVDQPAGEHPVAALSLAAPASLPVGGTSAPVTMTLSNGLGQPVPDGTRVRLATTLGNLAETELTTVGGQAATLLTTGSQAGLVTLTATAGRQATARVTFVPGPAHALSVSVSPAVAVVGEPGTTVRIEARDGFGNPVANGTPFNVSADGGTLARELGSTVVGGADVGWTSQRTGTNTVTVVLGELERTAIMTWLPGLPVRLSVRATPDEVPVVTGSSSIEVIAYDGFGNRVMSGLPVAFSASLGSVSPASAAMQDGVAVTTWSAPSTHGMAAIEATMAVAGGDPLSATALVHARSVALALSSTLGTPRGPAATNQLFPGDEVSYTLGVANHGLIDAEDMVLEVELPGEMLLKRVVATDDIFQRDPGGADVDRASPSSGLPYAWDLPDLAPGDAITITLAGRVALDRPWTGSDNLFYRASVTTVSDSEAGGPLQVSDLTRVVAGDLFIGVRLDESASRIEPGGELVYDVFFGNNQAQTQVFGALITDTLPAWTAIEHWQAATGIALREARPFSADDRTLAWAIDGYVPSSGSLRVWLRIADDVPPQTLLVNGVFIGSTVFDVAHGNDDAVDSGAWIAGVDLVAGLTGPRALVAGATGRYEISVLNGARRDRAMGIAMVVHLPPGVVAATIPPEAERSPGRVTWPVGALGAGARKRVTLDLVAPEASVPGQHFILRASVTGDVPDSQPTNDQVELDVLIAEIGSTDPAVVNIRAVPGAAGACPPGPTRIVATVLDGNGLHVADGAAVRFVTTRGTLSAPITTTVEGEATVQLAFAGPGRADVTADIAGIKAAVAVTGTSGAPDLLALAAATTAPALRSRVPLTVEARDGCGRVVADGWPIRLTAERGQFVGGSKSVELVTAGGRVTAVLEVGSQPGALRVTADHASRRATLTLDVRGVAEPTATPRSGGGTIYLPIVRHRAR